MVLTKRKLLYVAIAVLSVILVILLCIVSKPKAQPQPETLPTETVEPETEPPNPNQFTYINGFLSCVTADSIVGIDVSSHQGEIDWQQVKASGVEFVMIRAGYRGLDQGGLYEDEYAQSNYKGAKQAGLKIGAYFFSQATTEEEAIKEAEFALVITKDWQLDFPLAYDWEFSGEENRVAAITAAQVTEFAQIFCAEIEKAGNSPMVYFNPDLGRNFLYLEELTDYPFWLALYDRDFRYDYKITMWQYTCEGTVPGIEGNVDINLYFP